jgi:hypothetical protein
MGELGQDSGRRSLLKKMLVGTGAISALPLSGSRAAAIAASPQARQAQVRVHMDEMQGPLNINRYGVGHGGYSDQPIWLDRAGSEIRALNPKLIRLFVQEYYDLLPALNQYRWEKVDASVDMILKTGAKPLMCIAFRPKVLFPNPDLKVVEPNDWEVWETLVFNLVRHYRDDGVGIQYWEVGNEPPHGGDTPYNFTQENYLRYYQRTVAAVRRADPEARVGGPAPDFYTSPFLPALLSFCDREKVPIDFVSWHIYNDDPKVFRTSIESVKQMLSKHPSLRLETIIDEWNYAAWNSDGTNAMIDPSWHPCYVAEVTFQMTEGGLDYSCYYQVRDYYVAPEVIGFLPPERAAWWDHTLDVLGLFDNQNRVQPAYFVFRYLSRLTGDRLRLQSSDAAVHGLASYDKTLGAYGLLVWNFSNQPAHVEIVIEGAPSDLTIERVVLDVRSMRNPAFAPFDLEPPLHLSAGNMRAGVDLERYGIVYWSLHKH